MDSLTAVDTSDDVFNNIAAFVTKFENGEAVEFSVCFLTSGDPFGMIWKIEDFYLYKDETGSTIVGDNLETLLGEISFLYGYSTRH